MTCVAALRTTQPVNSASTIQLKTCRRSGIQIATAIISPTATSRSYSRTSISMAFGEDAFPEMYYKILPSGMHSHYSTLPLAVEVGYLSSI